MALDLSVALPGLRTFVTLSPIPGLARWLREQGIEAQDETRLKQLAAWYLTRARREDGRPLDPVARFHLGNGASVHMLHADADSSARGQAQSRGLMVNYLYDLARVAQNHERFAASKEIAASPGIRALAAAAESLLSTKEPAR